jgi:predicted transcriptional regulator
MKPWTVKEIHEVIKLREQGMLFKDIAKKLGHSKSCVSKYYYKYTNRKRPSIKQRFKNQLLREDMNSLSDYRLDAVRMKCDEEYPGTRTVTEVKIMKAIQDSPKTQLEIKSILNWHGRSGYLYEILRSLVEEDK